ncbi:hypothetical protein ACU6U9_20000 [Pseudomonas sp. HK3]|jgi:uncharacterized membrane protein
MTPDANSKKVVSLDSVREAKELDRKEEKVAAMAQRFEMALPTKATPIKDYLKKKRNAKNKKR